MRTRTKILVPMVASGLLCLTILVLLSLGVLRFESSLRRMAEAQMLHDDVIKLVLLANEFTPDNAERVAMQWRPIHDAVIRQMIGMEGEDGATVLALRNIGTMAERCFRLSESGRLGEAGIVYRSMQWQFASAARRIGRTMSNRVAEVRRELQHNQRQFGILTGALVFSLTVFMVIWLGIMRKAMDRLRSVSVHRDDLARELARRRQAERELCVAQFEARTAAENERARIGQELHDGVGQVLTAVRLHLETMERNGGELEASRLSQNLMQISENLRRVVRDLRPVALESLSLAAALEMLVAQVEKCGLQTHLSIDGDLRSVPDNLSRHLYRIVQEALHNVQRHADAKRIDVQLAVSEGAIDLTIEDDGIGFDPDSVIGVGLEGMRNRVESCGGEFFIESRQGRGTFVTASVPIK